MGLTNPVNQRTTRLATLPQLKRANSQDSHEFLARHVQNE